MNQLVTLKQALAFRDERQDLPAILLEYRSPSAGVLAEPVPRVAKSMIWVVVAIFVAALFLMAVIPIDKVVTAEGKVVSEAPTTVVQPLETGIVRSIDVRVGQLVKAGTILARLDPTFAQADVGQLNVQVMNLQAEVARLRAEATGEEFLYDGRDPVVKLQASIFAQRQAEQQAKISGFQARIEGARASVAKAVAESNMGRLRLEGARQIEGMRLELQKLGAGSKLQTIQAQTNRQQVEGEIQNADSTAAIASREMAAARSDLDTYRQSLITQATEDYRKKEQELTDAEENRKKANLRKNLVELRAERDSTVLSIANVSVGSVLQSGDQFIRLVPNDVAMEVEANISGQDNGFVHEGDQVTVKFATFPYQQYGTASGTVRMVSPDSFTQADESRSHFGITSVPASQANPGPFFMSRIALDKIDMHDVPGGFRAAAGMPVTADIKVGKRTVMTYLMNKVLPTLTEGMREP